MNATCKFCADWNLQLNTQKIEVIVFGVIEVDPVIIYRGVVLKVVKSFKYLGVTFASNMNWGDNTKRLLDQARKALMAMRCKTYMYMFTPGDMYMLFNQLVEPILSYGSEIWGLGEYPEIETFHKKFIRNLLSVRVSTKLDHLYLELGAIPLKFRRYIRVLGYWARLQASTYDRLSDKLFGLVRNTWSYTWCRGVRRIL